MGNSCCHKTKSYTLEHPKDCSYYVEEGTPDPTHKSLDCIDDICIDDRPRDDKKCSDIQNRDSPASNIGVHDSVSEKESATVCVNGKASKSNAPDTLKAEYAGDPDDVENIESAYEFIDIEIAKQNQRDMVEAYQDPVYDDIIGSNRAYEDDDGDDDKDSIFKVAAVVKSQDDIALNYEAENVERYTQDGSEHSGSIAETRNADRNAYKFRTENVPQSQNENGDLTKVTDSDDSDSDVIIPSQNHKNVGRIVQEDYSHELIKTTEHVSIVNSEIDEFQEHGAGSEITKDRLGVSLLPPDDSTVLPSQQYDVLYMTEQEAQNDTDMSSNDSKQILVSGREVEKPVYDNPGFTDGDLPTDFTTSTISNTRSGDSSPPVISSADGRSEMPPDQDDALPIVHIETQNDAVDTFSKDTEYFTVSGKEMDEPYYDNPDFTESDLQKETDMTTSTYHNNQSTDNTTGQSSYSTSDNNDTHSDVEQKDQYYDTSTKNTTIKTSTLLTIPRGESSPRGSSEDIRDTTEDTTNNGGELQEPLYDDVACTNGYLPQDTDSETSNLKINDSDDSSSGRSSQGFDVTNISDAQHDMVRSDTANPTMYAVECNDAVSPTECQVLPQETALQEEDDISSFTNNARDDSAALEETNRRRTGSDGCVEEDDFNEIWTKIEMEQENICYELCASDIKDGAIEEQLAETLDNVCSLRYKIFEKQFTEKTLEGRSTMEPVDGHEEMMLVEEIEMWFDEAVTENNEETANKLLTERSNSENLKTLLEEHGQNYDTLLLEKEQKKMVLQETLSRSRRDSVEDSEPDQIVLHAVTGSTDGEVTKKKKVPTATLR